MKDTFSVFLMHAVKAYWEVQMLFLHGVSADSEFRRLTPYRQRVARVKQVCG
jgi:hypothetical protein